MRTDRKHPTTRQKRDGTAMCAARPQLHDAFTVNFASECFPTLCNDGKIKATVFRPGYPFPQCCNRKTFKAPVKSSISFSSNTLKIHPPNKSTIVPPKHHFASRLLTLTRASHLASPRTIGAVISNMSARRRRTPAPVSGTRSQRSRNNFSELQSLVQALENKSANASTQPPVFRRKQMHSGPSSKRASTSSGSDQSEDPLDLDQVGVLPEIGIIDEEESNVPEPVRKKPRQSTAPKRRTSPRRKPPAPKPRVRFDSQPNTQPSQDEGATSEMEDMENTSFMQKLKELTEEKKMVSHNLQLGMQAGNLEY